MQTEVDNDKHSYKDYTNSYRLLTIQSRSVCGWELMKKGLVSMLEMRDDPEEKNREKDDYSSNIIWNYETKV